MIEEKTGNIALDILLGFFICMSTFLYYGNEILLMIGLAGIVEGINDIIGKYGYSLVVLSTVGLAILKSIDFFRRWKKRKNETD